MFSSVTDIDYLPYDCEYGAHCYRVHFGDKSGIYYSPHGASEQSGYTTTYIQYLCKQGQIDRFMYANCWFIPIDQVNKLKERKAEHETTK